MRGTHAKNILIDASVQGKVGYVLEMEEMLGVAEMMKTMIFHGWLGRSLTCDFCWFVLMQILKLFWKMKKIGGLLALFSMDLCLCM